MSQHFHHGNCGCLPPKFSGLSRRGLLGAGFAGAMVAAFPALAAGGKYEAMLVNCIDPRGRPYFWIGPPPKRDELDQTIDVGSLKAGHVTITPLSLNLTHSPTLQFLEKVFK